MNHISNYLFGKKDNKQKCNPPLQIKLTIDELFIWNKNNDYNLIFNKVNTPIKKRIISKKNKSKIAAFFPQDSIPSQGSNKFNIFNFDYWQYIDVFIYLPNTFNDKLIIIPPSSWIETAHKNGVKIYGVVYFPSNGDFKNITKLLERNNSNNKSSFPGADKLISLAKNYGFDGWYINQQMQGGNTETAVFIKEFCKYIHNNSNIEIMWYDSMINDGTINYQNKLNNLNESFFESNSDDISMNVSNMFILNNDWSIKSLKESKEHTNKLNRSPYDIYAAIDVNGFDFIKKVKDINLTTSIGLFNTSWTYTSSSSYDEFYKKQSTFWESLEPYVELNSPITSLPFITNFNTGQGKQYFFNGSIISNTEWNDISQQDIMPTWRKRIIKKDNNYVNTDICYSDSYSGGSCIRFDGLIKSKSYIDVDLFKTALNIKSGTKIIHIFTKRIVNFIKASLVLHFKNKKYVNLTLSDDIMYNVWAINKYKMVFDNNEIDKISIRFENINENKEIAFTLLLGGISIFIETKTLPNNPSNLKIIDIERLKHNENSKKHYIKDKINLNLSWDKNNNIWYYVIFRCIVSENSNSVEFIGRTSKNIYHIQNLTRKEDELYSLLSVKSVSYDQTVSVKESIIKI